MIYTTSLPYSRTRFINIGCAIRYHLSMMYVTVYNMSFNSNCRILAAELNYMFTSLLFIYFIKGFNGINFTDRVYVNDAQLGSNQLNQVE